MQKYKLLIIDDNLEFITSVQKVLYDFQIDYATSIIDAEKKVSQDYEIILLDLVFDDTRPEIFQGLDYLPELKVKLPDTTIIVLTNHSSTNTVVRALKLGATDFIYKKELDWIEWRNRLIKYCKDTITIKNLVAKSEHLEQIYDETELVGISKQIETIRLRLKDLAQNSNDITIFLFGETGTGKNLAVKYYRKHSLRKDKPYKEFSVSELSETVLESELFGHVKGSFTGADFDKKGLFEEADGGILFLDEIGDYDLKIQKKIMRFLEDKTITPVGSTKSKKLDVQLIVATNQNLQQLVSEEKFREDLYYRINVASIELPPLRERKEDIRVLTKYFFKHFKEKEKTNLKTISDEIYKIFEQLEWRGNVRELYYAIQSACANARLNNDSILLPSHLSENLKSLPSNKGWQQPDQLNLEGKKAIIELQAIEEALSKTNGKKSEAAKLLGMSLDQLRYKIKNIFNEQKININKYPNIKAKYFLEVNC
jgi:DNA-binding NtrC family response regulator